MAAMDTPAKVVDLAARRAERQGVSATPRQPPAAALEERQRETIEKLRALGYEMCHGRRQRAPGMPA